MNPEDIGKILDEIGKRIGPAGEYAWHIAVTFKRTEAIIGLSLILLALVSGIVMLNYGLRRATWADEANRYDMISILGGAFVMIGLIAIASTAMTLIPQALIPEWAVVQEIMRTLP